MQRLSRDVLAFWKRNEKEERELKRKAEREEAERRKMEVCGAERLGWPGQPPPASPLTPQGCARNGRFAELVGGRQEELREARRQQRKLNFLITQTELYSHFLAKKLGPTAEPETALPGPSHEPSGGASGGSSSSGNNAVAVTLNPATLDFDAADDATLREAARQQAMQGTAPRPSPPSPAARLMHAQRAAGLVGAALPNAAVGVLESKTRAFDDAAHLRRQEAKAGATSAAIPSMDTAGLDLTGACACPPSGRLRRRQRVSRDSACETAAGRGMTAPSTLQTAREIGQPKLLHCQLKGYQLKGGVRRSRCARGGAPLSLTGAGRAAPPA